jgi:flagellin
MITDNTGNMVNLGSAMLDLTTGGNSVLKDQAVALMATTGDGTVIARVTTAINVAMTGSAMVTMSPNAGTNGNGQATTGAMTTFKIGTGVDPTADEISVQISSVSTTSLGLNNTDITSQNNADAANGAVRAAIDALQGARSQVGAAQNRLDFAEENVSLARENQEAARSELEDLNVARAITDFSQEQLLVQAGTSTLSQANNLPQNLLQLFQ